MGITEGNWSVSEGNLPLTPQNYPTNGNVLVYADNDCDLHPIADCSANHTCRPDWECEANARAIAALPEIVSGLRSAIEWWDSDEPTSVFDTEKVFEAGRAALKKAGLL